MAVTVVQRSVVVRLRNKVGPAKYSNLTTVDCFNLVTVTCWYQGSGLIYFFDQSRLLRSRSIDQGSLYSRSIEALRLALRLALHRTVGSVSVQSIEALCIRSRCAAGASSNSRAV